MKFKEFLYYFLIVLLIGFMAFMIFYVVKNKYAFFENPFVYGAYKLGGVDCSCVREKDGKISTFSFNDTTFIRDRIIVKSFFDAESFNKFTGT